MKEGHQMARPKKVKYEYVEALGLYRKRIKSPTGQYCALYGRTPEELTEKIEEYETLRPLSAVGRENRLVNDYVQDWLDLHGETISFGTRVSYQSAIDQNIKPGMEGKRMLDVKPDDIKAVMRGVDGKSESIYRTTYMLLNQIFSSAYENHDILSNPCSTKIPSGGVPAKVRTALTDNQVEILLDTIKGTKSFVFCMIALYSGLRREEILGLQWDCVHLEKTPRIEVKRALRFEHNQPVVSEKLKTKAAKRVVPIPAILTKCLIEHKEHSNSAYVIANTSNGPLTQSQFKDLWNSVVCRSTKEHTYRKYSDGVMKKVTVKGVLGQKVKGHSFYYTIDFDVTPHILRHTYITNLLLRGVDIKTVQYLAGHEKSKITLDIYAHLTYNRPEEIYQKITMAFGNKVKEEQSNGKTEKAPV